MCRSSRRANALSCCKHAGKVVEFVVNKKKKPCIHVSIHYFFSVNMISYFVAIFTVSKKDVELICK